MWDEQATVEHTRSTTGIQFCNWAHQTNEIECDTVSNQDPSPLTMTGASIPWTPLARSTSTTSSTIFRISTGLRTMEPPLPDEDRWHLIPHTPGTPQQPNSFDCGVYVCAFIDLLLQELPLRFTPGEITIYRRRLVSFILTSSAGS